MIEDVRNNKELMNYLKEEISLLDLEINLKQQTKETIYLILCYLENIEKKQGD